MNHKLKTIDGETLMNTVLPSIDFVVDNFLSQGLHLLAGASKVGKSWLALWLALSIAKGEEVWNRKVKQGTTLYLCLEDNDVRIQSRLFDITDDAPNSVHFTMEASTIGNGLEEELEQFIADHPDTVLIIIDTLQMVRNSSGDNSYSNDYKDLSVLKKLADKHKIAILLIHHLRKEDAKDTFDRISGTTGIQGAVDSSFTLVETARGSGKAKLSCVSRDFPFHEIELQKTSENIWEMIHDSLEEGVAVKDSIIFLLSDFMKTETFYSGTATELADLLSERGEEIVSPRTLAKRLLQNTSELEFQNIMVQPKKTNKGRVFTISKRSEDSEDKKG